MIVLAQAQGDELSGFLSQPIVGPLLSMTCFFGVLLLVVVGALVYVRRRKAMAEQAAVVPPAAFVTDSLSGADMPDLDVLVNTFGMADNPPPRSAPAAPAPSRPARKGTFSVKPNDGNPTEAVEVMTVLRDVVDGSLIVQMGDKAYQNPSADPEFRERFNRVMGELGGSAAQPAAPVPPAPQPETQIEVDEPLPLSDLMTPAPADTPAQVKPKSSPPPPISSSGKLPGDLPSFKLEDNPLEKRKRGQKQDIKPVPELNIAGAIEAYLQYKLRHTPEFDGRSIHIYPSPDGGVSIEVDGSYYDAVSDIDDPNVREFIATAIQEWQERH